MFVLFSWCRASGLKEYVFLIKSDFFTVTAGSVLDRMNTRLGDGAASGHSCVRRSLQGEARSSGQRSRVVVRKLDPWHCLCEIPSHSHCCSAAGPYQLTNNNATAPAELGSFKLLLILTNTCYYSLLCRNITWPQPPFGRVISAAQDIRYVFTSFLWQPKVCE